MNRRNMPGYAVALAILIVGLVALGVPAATLFFVLILLGCPLMMMSMMGGMHGGGRDQQQHHNEDHTERHDPTSTR